MSAREKIVDYLRSQLMGPADGPTEVLIDRPHKRYAMGLLFPRDAGSFSSLGEEEDSSEGTGDDTFLSESPLSLSFQKLPSSFGVSFVVSGASRLIIDVSGARYEKEESAKKWKRVPLADPANPEVLSFEVAAAGRYRCSALGGRAELDVLARDSADGLLVTATLLNTVEQSGNTVSPEECLFQVGMRLHCDGGDDARFLPYPSRTRLSHDEEDRELELIYRSKPAYAIGHGCAADWDGGARPDWISAEFMPCKEVKPVTTALESGEADCLRIQYLMDPGVDRKDLRAELDKFVKGYENWINALDAGDDPVSQTIVKRLTEAAGRMARGVELLCAGEDWILDVFRLASRAMLRQMIHAGKTDAGKPLSEGFTEEVDYESGDFGSYAWRPFQLAFQLLSLPSLAGEAEEDIGQRDIVDLIWFPTGGGKTEAYLAVAAFEMFARRIRFGAAGGGTSVIKRYTLRLLTTQQFERAAALVTAMENMRRDDPDTFGSEPFSLGLWVGGDTVPNQWEKAEEKYVTMLDEDRPLNPFVLQKCPHCGTSLVPEARVDDRAHYGFIVTPAFFKFRCPDPACRCHSAMDDLSPGTGIPVAVIDESLYTRPPSLLIGTIDKFARLTWEPRAAKFLGAGTGCMPPSLIIQDEMHLISGPLGTIAGLYESAIDTAIRRLGGRPKIIAATATIRRAGEQALRLYGREVRVFPPSGLDADNSYFARIDHDAEGRLYVGAMAQGHTPIYSEVMLASAVAQAPVAAGLSDDELDAYWTMVIYHNSRRELGKTMTLSRDDIPARLKLIEAVAGLRRKVHNVEELSANIKGADIPKVLERLKIACPAKGALDILPCTNMISVGVDVSRLSLMLMIGQPKTTAEYIQASSRVGRSDKRPPGLVITLYSNAKPRDRSHYESFVSYHSALYRAVEPTSVTPYAPPARERAMHAALIALLRIAGGYESNASAGQFDPGQPNTEALIEALLERMITSEPEEEEGIRAHLHALADRWRDLAAQGNLRFYIDHKTFKSLIRNFGEKSSGEWQTLQSMRNVDAECKVRVISSMVNVTSENHG